MRIISLAALLLGLMASRGHAVARYVDATTVACSGDYSIAARACTGADGTSHATISACTDAAAPADTCEVRAGTYTTGLSLTATSSGTEGSNVLLRAYNGEAVVIGARMILTNVSFLQVGDVGNGFTFTGFSDAVGALNISSNTDLDISCAVALPDGGTAVLADKGSCGLKIVGNTFTDIQSTCTGVHCAAIYVAANAANGRRMAGLTVSYNTITASQTGIDVLVCDYCRFEHNVIHDLRPEGTTLEKFAIKISNASVFTYVGHNTIYDINLMNDQNTGGVGIWMTGETTDAVIEQNLLYRLQGPGLVDERSFRHIWRYNIVFEAEKGFESASYSSANPSTDFQVYNNTFAGSVLTDACFVRVADGAGTGPLFQRNILHGLYPIGINSDIEGDITWGENLLTTGSGSIISRGASGGLPANYSCVARNETENTTFTAFEAAVGDIGTQATQTFFCTGESPCNLNLVAGSSGLTGCAGGTECGALKQPTIASCSVEDATPNVLNLVITSTGSEVVVLDTISLAPTVNAVARNVTATSVVGTANVYVTFDGAAVGVGNDVDLPALQGALRNDWCIGSSLCENICSQSVAQTLQCTNNVTVAAPTATRSQYTWQVRTAEAAFSAAPTGLYGFERDITRIRPGGRAALLLGLAVTADTTASEVLEIACADNGGTAYELGDTTCTTHLACLDATSAIADQTAWTTPRPFYTVPAGTTFARGGFDVVGARGPAVREENKDYAIATVLKVSSTAVVGDTVACWLRLADDTDLEAYSPAKGTAIFFVSGPFGAGK